MHATVFSILVFVAIAGCAGGARNAPGPAGSDEHYAAACDGAGHAPWRGEAHPTRELAADDAQLHGQKFPGHTARVEPVAGH